MNYETATAATQMPTSVLMLPRAENGTV